MSRKHDDLVLVVIKKEPEFGVHHQQPQLETQEVKSHYECLLTTNREEPEQFMNSTRKQETEPELLEPEVYVNIAHAKEEAQKPEFGVHHQQPELETQKVKSHYECLLTANREEPEQFMNSTRKQETEPELLEPEVYVNIAHAKKEAQPNAQRLSQEKGTAKTDKGAADVTPIPAVTPKPTVLSHYRAMDILKTYIKAEPVTKEHRNTAGSDTESDTSDFTPAYPPQQSSTSSSTKFTRPYLNGDGNSPENVHVPTLSSSSNQNKYLLFSIVACCVLMAFLVFTLLLTFVGLNRSELMKNQAEDSHLTATSNMLIMNLTKQVRDLEESLNQSNAMIQNLSNQNQLLSSSIDSHSTRLAAAENTLQSHVTDYRDLVSTSESNHDTLTASISGNYADLNNRINTLQGVVNTNRNSANSQISQLQSGINLESRCNRGIESCNVTGDGSVYQLSCETSPIPRTISVSHTCQQYNNPLHSFYSLLFRITTMLSVWTACSRSTVPLSLSHL